MNLLINILSTSPHYICSLTLVLKGLIDLFHSPKSFVPKIQHCSHCWVSSKQVLLHSSLCSDVRPVPRLWNLHQPGGLMTPLIVHFLCISISNYCNQHKIQFDYGESMESHLPGAREFSQLLWAQPMATSPRKQLMEKWNGHKFLAVLHLLSS